MDSTQHDFRRSPCVCVCVDNNEDRWQDIGSFTSDVCKLQRSQSGKSRSRSSPAARRWTTAVLKAEAEKVAADAKSAADMAAADKDAFAVLTIGGALPLSCTPRPATASFSKRRKQRSRAT